MADRDPFTDEQIQAYIDNQLSERDRAAVAAYLLAHPNVARTVETLRRQSEALRGIGQEILDEPVPARLRNAVYQPVAAPPAPVGGVRSSSFLEAAAAILLFCVGGGLGWFMHDRLTPKLSASDLIAAEAVNLFSFYGTARDYPIDFPPDRTTDLVSWLGKSFEREVPPPDLASMSNTYQGGRILPTHGSRGGFFQFQGPEDTTLAVFFWPSDSAPSRLSEIEDQGNVSAKYWFNDGLSFAVMSNAQAKQLEPAAQAVFDFYKQRSNAN
ncbi:MAG: anti-sigma factor family protein [Geminicoccaceae bacterium]